MQSIYRYVNAHIVAHARFLYSLTLSIRSKLPPSIANHCWTGGIYGDTLTIVTDGASWGVKARYQQYEILKQINTEFRSDLQTELRRIKIKVANIQEPTTTGRSARVKKPISRPVLSRKNAQLLTATAVNSSDSEIKSALLKLANRARS